ncbi:hypothetical protein GCM10027174_23790 [Salinifilum aidingensis]
MSKPKHRAPSAGRRQWLLWTITAVGIPVVCTALTGGGLPLFTVLAACFTAGTFAADVLLGRPMRRLPVSGPAARVAPAPPAVRPRALPARASDGNTSAPVAPPRRRGGEDAVTLLRTSDHVPEITLVPAAHPRVPDPAETAAARTGAHERGREDPGEDDGRVAGTGEWPRTAPPAPREPDSGGQRTLPRESAPPHPPAPQAEPDEDDQPPFPGAVWAKPDGRSPDKEHRIKGNVRSKRYHTMQSPYYERTKATVWFRSAAEAEQAGFSPWNRRLQNNN